MSRETVKDPKIEFAQEIATASILARNFARLSSEYNKDLLDYKLLKTKGIEDKLHSKQIEIELDLKRLIAAEQKLHAGRELVYRQG